MSEIVTTAPAAARPLPLSGRLRRVVMRIAEAECDPSRRGFRTDRPEVRERLFEIGRTFLAGYHAGLADPRPEAVASAIESLPAGRRGFAWEGAGFALTLLDTLAPRPGRPGRLEQALAGPGGPHVYLVLVGTGWALARLPKRIGRHLARFDRRLAWLALDGWGFHDGYFHHPRAIGQQRVPRRLAGYARRGYDQGLGRSLWFVEGADPERVAATIGRFAEARRGDLWAGVGLACAYAGGVEREAVEWLARLAGGWVSDLAQGAAFAAQARQLASDPSPAAELACLALWGAGTAEVAAATVEVLAELEASRPAVSEAAAEAAGEPFFEAWRRGIRARHAALGTARAAG